MNNILKVKKLNDNACLPEYVTDSDVCFDVRSLYDVNLKSMEQKEIKTGLILEIPEGYVGLIRDRAGVVTKLGCHVIAGTIDSSYREEFTILLINFGMDDVQIEEGMRVAQILIVPVNKLEIEEVKELTETKRTGKKFGSTGLK
ncbi:MAG: dUTP diphosphatase [Candidatus Nanoarchaeia archaeon]|nr:dUTP diphosphatase [Candidatus Nanoarchaeia archaeon]